MLYEVITPAREEAGAQGGEPDPRAPRRLGVDGDAEEDGGNQGSRSVASAGCLREEGLV